MACQLDAGAKIYSLRVDAVHQQVVKLVDSCIYAEKKANTETGEGGADSDDENQPGTSDGKTKEKKKRVITLVRFKSKTDRMFGI